jgi:hypothetical protein
MLVPPFVSVLVSMLVSLLVLVVLLLVLVVVLLLVFVLPPQAINMQITKGKIQASENILIKDFIKLSFLILHLL